MVARAGEGRAFEPPAPPKTRKAAASRRLLMSIAAELFLERGYTDVSLQNIADRAGLTKAAIYGHFRSKGQLLIEVIRQVHADWEESERFSETMQRHAIDLMQDPGGHAERVLELEAAVAARHDPDVAAGIAEFRAERMAVIRRRVDGVVADPETVAWVVWALSTGFGISDLVGTPPPDPDRVEQLIGSWVVDRPCDSTDGR